MKKIQKWESQFIIVALGQAISMLGSHGVQFALIWWLAEKTSSPFILGISGIVAYILPSQCLLGCFSAVRSQKKWA